MLWNMSKRIDLLVHHTVSQCFSPKARKTQTVSESSGWTIISGGW